MQTDTVNLIVENFSGLKLIFRDRKLDLNPQFAEFYEYTVDGGDGITYHIGSKWEIETNKEVTSFVIRKLNGVRDDGMIANISSLYKRTAFLNIAAQLTGITQEILEPMFLNLRISEISLGYEGLVKTIWCLIGGYDRDTLDGIISSIEALGYEVKYRMTPWETEIAMDMTLRKVRK